MLRRFKPATKKAMIFHAVVPCALAVCVTASTFLRVLHSRTTCRKVHLSLQKLAEHPALMPAGKALKALVSRVLDKAPTTTHRAVTVVAQTFSDAADYDKILKVCTCQQCRHTMQLVRPLLSVDAVPVPACCEACTAQGLHTLARALFCRS